MEELDLGKPEKLKVKYGGEVYELDFPDVERSHKLQQETQKENVDSVKLTVELISDLGMPEEILWKMQPQTLQKLAERLMAADKKK